MAKPYSRCQWLFYDSTDIHHKEISTKTSRGSSLGLTQETKIFPFFIQNRLIVTRFFAQTRSETKRCKAKIIVTAKPIKIEYHRLYQSMNAHVITLTVGESQ